MCTVLDSQRDLHSLMFACRFNIDEEEEDDDEARIRMYECQMRDDFNSTTK